MTAPAGSSEVFWGGVITYADEAKVRLLGVSAPLIEEFGAVSGQVAVAMVQGLVSMAQVPLAVSITGVAGPGGGSPDKPVGTVWFGLARITTESSAFVAVKLHLEGTRSMVQRQAARWARVLAVLWWVSGAELDSLRSLTDNTGKLVVKAFQTLLPTNSP